MQANIRRHAIVFTASCYVAVKLSYQAVKPYAVRFWQLATSEQAQRCYAFLILSVIALVWMSMFAAVWLGNRSREQYDLFLVWRDQFVESHLAEPAEILVGDEIAAAGCALLAELFAQADVIMARPIDAGAPATPAKRKPKGFQSQQEVIV